jgi:uncharacterized Zn-finger protein
MEQTLAPPEIVQVDTINVSCHGGGGVLGHPKVYLSLVNGEVECPYCDKKFILRSGATPVDRH